MTTPPVPLRLPVAGLAAAVVIALTGCSTPADAPVAATPSGSDAPLTAPTVPADTPTAVDPATAAPVTVDPCMLLTDEEAERLAGTPLQDPVPAGLTCTRTGPVTGPTAQVEVFVGDGAKKYLDIQRSLGHELRTLPGIGDECLADESEIFVRRGDLWVSVRLVRLVDPAENAEPLAEAARTVATRI
ncbi:Protein of unknown function [Micromonospora nigra]|uniref:DUF3558 domain-containing protein n=1 Tax=Micromonospora nigra TaxID=145857 RepID=A0A1C6RHL0_9ACTN|nr:DUF3558 family protein [Micromonospora nigra]SCL16481.1 Protein of unknown function [Micromonospora nigra]